MAWGWSMFLIMQQVNHSELGGPWLCFPPSYLPCSSCKRPVTLLGPGVGYVRMDKAEAHL